MRFERSLIVLKSYLGDTVMSTPLVRSVGAEFGATDVLGSSICEQLLRYRDLRLRFENYGSLKNPLVLFRAARRVRQGHYDAAFVVNRSFRSALMCRMAGVPRRVGHSTEGRGSLLTDQVSYDDDRNEAESYLDLLRAIQVEPRFVEPCLELSEAESHKGREIGSGATIGIQAGARHEYKRIPAEVWHEVGKWLQSRGHRLAFLGGAEERQHLAELRLEGVDIVGNSTLRETLGVLGSLKGMLGGDTGVMHLAAAVGTPTVTVFGRTSAKKWGWFREPHQVIQARNGDTRTVTADEVITAAERALCASR